MDPIMTIGLIMVGIGGGMTLLIFAYRKLKGESFWFPELSRMQRGDPRVVVTASGYLVETMVQLAAKYGYTLASMHSVSGGIDVGYVSDPYVFLPPQRETEYILTFTRAHSSANIQVC